MSGARPMAVTGGRGFADGGEPEHSSSWGTARCADEAAGLLLPFRLRQRLARDRAAPSPAGPSASGDADQVDLNPQRRVAARAARRRRLNLPSLLVTSLLVTSQAPSGQVVKLTAARSSK